MIPGSFEIDTAKEMIDDSRCRLLEDDARIAAETNLGMSFAGIIRKPGISYWDEVMYEMEKCVWITAYQKRVNRLMRLKNASQKEKE